jgi:serine protease Do
MEINKKQAPYIALAALIAVVSSVLTFMACYYFLQSSNSASPENYSRYANYYNAVFSGRAQQKFLSSAPTNFIQAARITTPSVVNIKAMKGGNFSGGSGEFSTSNGSGVVVSPDGYIVTNHHVVDGSSEIEISLSDKRKFPATLVGTDPSTDIALLKIETQELPFIVFGNSDSLQVGEWILAVGNPFNLESTVTAGIISAKGRSIDVLEDAAPIESFIQTDAVVNPGNSGGAMVNSNGELVGINSAIITKTGHFEGYSFAVPGNLVQKVIKDLKDYGVVQRGFLGIAINDLNTELANSLSTKNLNGVYVRSVTQGGAASDAGIKPGDIILKINGIDVKTTPELQEQIGRLRPGNTVTLDYFRDGSIYKSEAILKNKSNSTTIVSARSDKTLKDIGLELRALNRKEINGLGFTGVRVQSVQRGSKIEKTNMEPSFIITNVNDQRVTTVEEILTIMENGSSKITFKGIYEGYKGEYLYVYVK